MAKKKDTADRQYLFLKREKYEKIYDYQNSLRCFDDVSIHDNCIKCVKFFSRISDDFHKKNERSSLSR